MIIMSVIVLDPKIQRSNQMNPKTKITECYNAMIKAGDFFEVCPECGGAENIPLPHDEVGVDECPICTNGIDPNTPISKLLMKAIWSITDASKAWEDGKIVDSKLLKNYFIETANETEACKIMVYNKIIKNTFQDHLTTAYIKLLAIAGFLGVEIEEAEGTRPRGMYTHFYSLISAMPRIEAVADRDKETFDHSLHWLVFTIEDICQQNNIDLEKHLELNLKFMEASK
jgi:hypothetical protein